MARRRQPPGEREDFRIKLRPETIERLEQVCLRRTARRPFKNVIPGVVARYAVLKYLEEAEAREAAAGRRRPPCIHADCVGGLKWCPEHGVSWREGQEVPASCRGDE